jgi:hypothetical protein
LITEGTGTVPSMIRRSSETIGGRSRREPGSRATPEAWME